MTNDLAALCAAGLSLVPIPPISGKPSKNPARKNWNYPRSPNNPNGYSSNAAHFANCEGFNFGLYHGASGTLALDLDDLNQAVSVFENISNVNLSDWFVDPGRLEIKSPKHNRGKLVFKLPHDFDVSALGVKQLKQGQAVVFELRCGNCQDVIIGQHPEGGAYQLIGNPAAIPAIPDILLDLLKHWEAWKPCLNSALGIEPGPPKIITRKPQQGENLHGWRDPIREFNQSYTPEDVLLRNAYKPVGKDRFLRPGSMSKAPGVVILRNCADGIARAYSHGGDVLNDGLAHDAFDCMRLLEYGGLW